MRKKKAAAVLLFIYILTFALGGVGAFAAAEECDGCVECDVKLSSRLWELLFGREIETGGESNLSLAPGGDVFGAKIVASYVSIGDVGEHKDLKVGDIILKVNGKAVSTVDEVKSAVEAAGGHAILLTLLRGGEEVKVNLTPSVEGGKTRLGIVLRDGAAGIGTVTYIDKETGLFGGLGHAICDRDTGEVIELRSGVATKVVLGGVKRGTAGAPGELTGILTKEIDGELYKNWECGIFGRLDASMLEGVTEIPVGRRDEVHEGGAEIISTLKNGKPQKFSVEIHDIDADATGNKCFKVKVTDDALVAISGGIVRGMSGSPIIQDGKLIGAVTHVLVGDPTEGYGIFIENMLNAAQMPEARVS
jgi:stage IV sporulation protein B